VRAGIDSVGRALLPDALRKQIREAAPRRVIVIPDGPLHGLPLESLVLEGGERPRYALEELPPLLYAPSAPALAFLLERPAPAADRPLPPPAVGGVAVGRAAGHPVGGADLRPAASRRASGGGRLPEPARDLPPAAARVRAGRPQRLPHQRRPPPAAGGRRDDRRGLPGGGGAERG